MNAAIKILPVDYKCGGCNGTGSVPSSHGWGNGPCAACGGKGTCGEKTAAKKAEKREARAAARKADAKKLFPDAVELLENYEGNIRFVKEIAARYNEAGFLSEKQAAAVVKTVAQAAVDAITATPVVTGRIVLEGEIVSMKETVDFYGAKVVIVLKDDRGFKVYGRIPAKLLDAEVNTGSRVRFTATVTESDKDKTFGFYSRPTKAEVLA